MAKAVIDTNVLLDQPDVIDKFDEVILPIQVLEEIDGLKKSQEIGYKARQATRKIIASSNISYDIRDSHSDMPLHWDKDKRDNLIVLSAYHNNAILISNDLNVRIKAQALGVATTGCEDIRCDLTYTGFKIIEMPQEKLATWYENEVKANLWDLIPNQYLLIKTNDKIVDHWVWTESGFKHLSIKKVDSSALGKLKLLDDFQMCAMDSLCNNAVTMIKGSAGTGKSHLTMAYSISMLEKNKLDKLIVFTNPLATKNSARLGFYPGTKDEKLLDSQIGHMLSSKLGDRHVVEQLIRSNKLILLPFSDIRGFDTTGMKALIWITEAQNLDIELMRLAIQRVGDDCQIVIDGDYKAQVDCSSFEGSNNGMMRVSEVFRGKSFYGEIELQNTYRSKWAEIANLL